MIIGLVTIMYPSVNVKMLFHLGIMSCLPFCCYGVKFSSDELSYRI